MTPNLHRSLLVMGLAVSFATSLACEPAPSRAQGGFPAKPRREPKQQPKPKKQQDFQKAAVVVAGQSIAPGEVVQVLFGSLGPPDNLRAMRGKQPENDYVLFTYDSYGISFHIKTVNNQNNVVDLIVVMESNVKITGVPFRVGDEYRLVTSQWGEPDRQEAGFAAYWHRGIFLGVNEQGRITTITVAAPGKVDEDQPAPSQGWVPPCLPGCVSVSGAQGASAPVDVPASSHWARAACGA